MICVSAEKVSFAHRRLIPHAQTVAGKAYSLVHTRFGALPPVSMVLTSDYRHMAQLSCSAEFALVPGAHPVNKFRHERDTRRELRDCCGVTVLTQDGALIVINLGETRTGENTDVTVVHELVHAHQLVTPAARSQQIAYMQHGFGLHRLPRREVRAYEALIDRRETEARTAERLAAHIAN